MSKTKTRSDVYTATVEKHGRIWTQITIHYPSGYDGKAQIAKTSVADVEPGKSVTLRGYIEKEYTRYGVKNTFICESEEEAAQREIARWWGYFCEKRDNDGYFYSRAVDELHVLGCHEYDEEIRQSKRTLEANRWIGYFREHLVNGQFYERAVTELHALGCRIYDEEIRQGRAKIEGEKEAARKEKLEKEKAEGICNLVIPAYYGFRGRPQRGETLMHRGIPYEVISSYYHDSDGYSFGANNEEWYSVKAKNIADTPKGQEMIEKAQRDKRAVEACRKAEIAKHELRHEIVKAGHRYEGPEMSVSDIDGTTILDTFNIYGGGELVRVSATDCWLIVNNGFDGADWSVNNIRTGGAGAYAYCCPVSAVKQFVMDLIPYADRVEELEKQRLMAAIIADDKLSAEA